jgi:DnaJ-class molecular chaperone
MTDEYETCPDCDGSGNDSIYDDEYSRCKKCNGKGYIKE